MQNLQKKHAFDKLFLNRQNAMMEQLLTDNENLMDQIQELSNAVAQPTMNSNEMVVQANTYPDDNPDAYELYNGVSGIKNQMYDARQRRNNSKTDQTQSDNHSTFENQNLLKLQQPLPRSISGIENNSSNKDLSPGVQVNKDTAFMRAMLREETPQMSPFQFRSSNNLEDKLKAEKGQQPSASFFEDF